MSLQGATVFRIPGVSPAAFDRPKAAAQESRLILRVLRRRAFPRGKLSVHGNTAFGERSWGERGGGRNEAGLIAHVGLRGVLFW
jgi:hypothetical protein